MVVDFKQDVLELRVKNMLKNEVRIVFNTTFLLRSKGRSLFNLFRRIPGGHDPRHSLIESISVCRRASSRERSARRRHVQEQKGQRATHLEMQGEAQEGRDSGHGGLAGEESVINERCTCPCYYGKSCSVNNREKGLKKFINLDAGTRLL